MKCARLLCIMMMECVRRFFWNLLRLENEQISNCDLFRAVLEIPLPTDSLTRACTDEDDDDEETEDDGEQQADEEAADSAKSATDAASLHSTAAADLAQELAAAAANSASQNAASLSFIDGGFAVGGPE